MLVTPCNILPELPLFSTSINRVFPVPAEIHKFPRNIPRNSTRIPHSLVENSVETLETYSNTNRIIYVLEYLSEFSSILQRVINLFHRVFHKFCGFLHLGRSKSPFTAGCNRWNILWILWKTILHSKRAALPFHYSLF
ncbi:MAG: hypothetical protein IJM51_03150, partial [Clostridia bacterium]|nr:hypothetical protein [Clostridia bacterium]